MKNNIEPEEEKYGWNSSKEAVPGLTCKEAASVLTSFSSTFRALVIIEREFGFEMAVKQAVKMIQAQIEGLDKGGVVGPKRKDTIEKTSLAIGMALVSIGACDPQTVGLLASQAIIELVDVQGKIGEKKFNESIIRFNVRRVEPKNPGDHHGLEVGAEAIPMEEIAKKIEEAKESAVVQEAIKVADSIIELGSKKVDPSNN